jgi:GTPase
MSEPESKSPAESPAWGGGTPKGHVGTAAIVGRPNVGKSTLLNRLLGQKLAIVSHLPQTTRNRILGVRTWDGNQLALLDTPGIHDTRARRGDINRFMVQEALDSLGGVDCVVLMTEVGLLARSKPDEVKAELHPEDAYVLEQVEKHRGGAPIVVALNKIDKLADRRALLPLMAGWSQRGPSAMVPISAQTGDGVDALLGEVLEHLPCGPLLYPEDMLTDRPERFLCAELIREQVFLCFRQEVPYSTAVEVVAFEERAEQKDVRIEAVIFVERESQKAILIGKGGSAIKKIGTAARGEIAQLLDCPAHLQLTVRVADEWTRKPASRRRFGYES